MKAGCKLPRGRKAKCKTCGKDGEEDENEKENDEDVAAQEVRNPEIAEPDDAPAEGDAWRRSIRARGHAQRVARENNFHRLDRYDAGSHREHQRRSHSPLHA